MIQNTRFWCYDCNGLRPVPPIRVAFGGGLVLFCLPCISQCESVNGSSIVFVYVFVSHEPFPVVFVGFLVLLSPLPFLVKLFTLRESPAAHLKTAYRNREADALLGRFLGHLRGLSGRLGGFLGAFGGPLGGS